MFLIFLKYSGSLWFQIPFNRLFFSLSVKRDILILLEIALNLKVAVGSVDILIVSLTFQRRINVFCEFF